MKPIEMLEEREVYANQYVRVFDDSVRFRSGTDGSYIRVCPRTPGKGVVIVAVKNGQLALVKTYRYPIQQYQWAFPRGFAHGPDALASAGAELAEELGATAHSMHVIGSVTPDSGIQTNHVSVVVANIADIGQPTDHDEVVETTWVSTGDLLDRIVGGEIEDAFTLAALLLFLHTRDASQ